MRGLADGAVTKHTAAVCQSSVCACHTLRASRHLLAALALPWAKGQYTTAQSRSSLPLSAEMQDPARQFCYESKTFEQAVQHITDGRCHILLLLAGDDRSYGHAPWT